MPLFSTLVVLAIGRWQQWDRGTMGVLLLVVPLGNTSFLGIPMIQAFFGAAGLPYLIIYDQLGTMMIMGTYGSVILALYGRKVPQLLPVCPGRHCYFRPPSLWSWVLRPVAGTTRKNWRCPRTTFP